MGDSRPCIGAIARDLASDVSPGRAHDISDVAHSPRPRNKQCCARKRRLRSRLQERAPVTLARADMDAPGARCARPRAWPRIVDRHIDQACADQKRLNWNSSRPRSARRTRMKKPRQEAGLGRSMGLPGMRKMANHRHHITVGCTPQGRPRRKSPAGAGLSPMRAAEKGGGNAAHTDTIPQPVAQRAGDSRGSVPDPVTSTQSRHRPASTGRAFAGRNSAATAAPHRSEAASQSLLCRIPLEPEEHH